jgi:hypothetical protein
LKEWIAVGLQPRFSYLTLTSQVGAARLLMQAEFLAIPIAGIKKPAEAGYVTPE